jgi:hypothetical protein
LLVSVEEPGSRIVSDKIDFSLLVASQHDNIVEDSGRQCSSQLGQLKAVTMQMNGMNVISGIAHPKPVTLALRQVERGRIGSLVMGYATPLIVERLNPCSAAFSFANVVSKISSGEGSVRAGLRRRRAVPLECWMCESKRFSDSAGILHNDSHPCRRSSSSRSRRIHTSG